MTKVRGRTKLAAVADAAADCTNCDLYRNATIHPSAVLRAGSSREQMYRSLVDDLGVANGAISD